MKLQRLFLLVLPLLLAQRASAGEHPSLLFDAEDIPEIRARLDGPLWKIRDALEAAIHFPFAGGNFPLTPDLNYEHFRDRRGPPDSLLTFAFGAAILDPDTPIGREARQLAHNYLTGICNYRDWVFAETQDGPDPDLNSAHHLFAVALAYDWLYHDLSEADRQRCRDKVAVEGEKVYQAMRRNVWWMVDLLQNHNWINTASLGMAALAFEGELTGVDTEAWLRAVNENMEKVHYVADLVEGGAWHEGPGYLNYGFDSLIPYAVALVRKRGGPDWADNHAVRDFPTLRRFMMLPSRERRRDFGVLWGNYSNPQNENTLLSTYYLVRTYRDGHAAWYAERFLEGALGGREDISSWAPSLRGALLATLLYDERVEPVPPPHKGAAWELDYFAKDLSLWVSRSGWEDGGSLLALKTGVFGGHGNFERLSQGDAWPGGFINFGHDHADDNGFYFFADGEWLTTAVPGYWIGRPNGAPEANRTKYANSLLIDGEGQLGEGVRTCHMRSCPWFFERIGTIPLRGSTANFSYALGAGSQLYPREKGLETFGRSVLFLDRELPVVRDVVRANQPRRFEIVYHAMDQVARDGDWLRLHSKNDRAAALKVVSPPGFALRTENQSLVHLDRFDPDGRMTAAMIGPLEDAREVIFLTALAPVRASAWNQKPTIEALDPQVPGRGLTITGWRPGERFDVLFNEAPSHSDQTPELGVTGMAGVKKTREGEVVRLLVAAGHELRIGEEKWISIGGDAPRTLEVDYTEEGVRVSGDAEAFRVRAPREKQLFYNGEPVAFSRDGDFLVYPAEQRDEDPGEGGAPGGEGGAGGSIGGPGCHGDGSAPGSEDGQGGAGGAPGTEDGAGGAGGKEDGPKEHEPPPSPLEPGKRPVEGPKPHGKSRACSASGPLSQASPLAFAWLALWGSRRNRRR